jgi:ATP-binding cassette subfamily F protein 3
VLRPFDGDLDDYAQWLQQDRREAAQDDAARAGAQLARDGSSARAATAGGEGASGGGAARVDARRDRARARAAASVLRQPLEKRIRRIEEILARNQARAAEIDRHLAAPDAYDDREHATELGRERARLSADIQALEDEWLELHAELESLESGG